MFSDVIPLTILRSDAVSAEHDEVVVQPASGSVAYHLVTLGCPKNVVDSESLESAMRRHGHVPVDRPSAADLLVVNTCGFIDASKEESINAVLSLAAVKRADQQLVV